MKGTGEYTQKSDLKKKHSDLLRGPTQISFDITNECNLNCKHCFNRSGENEKIKKELSDEEKLDFIKQIKDLKPFNFCFCGGEPLIKFNLICEGAKILSENDINVSMVSNGWFLTKDKINKLKSSGVNRLQISLDGEKESHEYLRGKEGSFQRAIKAIEHGVDAGLDTSVAFCPTAFNFNEIEDVFNIVKEIGVNEFRIQPLMLLGRGKNNYNIEANKKQYIALLKDIEKLKKKYHIKSLDNGFDNVSGSDIKIQWGDPIDHLIRQRTSLKSFWTVVGVQADGSIAPSPYLPITVGNIRNHSFKDYWENGLSKIWEFKVLRDIAGKINCVKDMGNFSNDNENIPQVWFEENLELDLIDDDLLGENSDLSLNEFFEKSKN